MRTFFFFGSGGLDDEVTYCCPLLLDINAPFTVLIFNQFLHLSQLSRLTKVESVTKVSAASRSVHRPGNSCRKTLVAPSTLLHQGNDL